MTDLTTDRQSEGEQIYVQIDRQKASQLRVQIDAVDNVLYDCFGQRQISIIFTAL
jgi:multidrug efflux pump subunit AcrB